MKQKRPDTVVQDTRFAFYHQNEALLFQFLLHECLRTHQILRKKPDQRLFLQVVGNLQLVSANSHAPNGHLPRLHHFCHLFNAHFENSSDWSNHLAKNLEKTLLAAKKCFSAFQTNTRVKHYPELRKEIFQVVKHLFLKLSDFKENASVLFFLLRHQEQFDALYREPIIKQTFLTLFPEGMAHAHLFLVEKFTKKGFNHLIPCIEQKLKKLDLPRTKKRWIFENNTDN